MAKSRNRTTFLHLAALLVVASWSSASRLTHQPLVELAEAAATGNTSSTEKLRAYSKSYDTSSPSVAQDEPPSAEAPAKESPSNQENPTLLPSLLHPPEVPRMASQEELTLLENPNSQRTPKNYASAARGRKNRKKRKILAGVFGAIGGGLLSLALFTAVMGARMRLTDGFRTV